ncbi:hypothetical protein KGO95_04250 [Patescibacteria group bacterium]|nr:hypothetical protein [Patescibacteria group bacterium]
MNLAIAAPLWAFVGLMLGMTHQIKIVIDIRREDMSVAERKRCLKTLSIPRIGFAVVSGVLWGWYGAELHNQWMVVLNIIGTLLNVCLFYIIYTAVPRRRS